MLQLHRSGKEHVLPLHHVERVSNDCDWWNKHDLELRVCYASDLQSSRRLNGLNQSQKMRIWEGVLAVGQTNGCAGTKQTRERKSDGGSSHPTVSSLLLCVSFNMWFVSTVEPILRDHWCFLVVHFHCIHGGKKMCVGCGSCVPHRP